MGVSQNFIKTQIIIFSGRLMTMAVSECPKFLKVQERYIHECGRKF